VNEAGENLDKMWPICVTENRYGMHIGGGAWLAVAKATEWCHLQSRIGWVLHDGGGPHGDERDAVAFWKHPPRWIAAGATPEAAIKALKQKIMD
jgi:hypothetical protein